MSLCFLQYYFWFCFVSAVLADYNITYDDTDPSVTYSPPAAWTHLRDDTTKDRYGGTTSRSTTLGANASLNFTGATAIYFMSYGVTSGVDEATIYFDQSRLTVSLQSSDNAKAQKIIYSKKFINPNATHNIVVSNDRGASLEVDVFIVTLPGDAPPGVSTFPGPNSSSQGPDAGAIAGGIVAACVALLAAVGGFYWYRRRRRIQSKALEPLPLTTTNLMATAPRRTPVLRSPLSEVRVMPETPHTTSSEFPAKAEYRGNLIPSVVSGSGSSGLASSSSGARNMPIIYSPPLSHVTATTIPPSPPHSLHPFLPPPSYAAATSDVRIHEEHDPE